jgi:hypothetical protein
MVTQAAMASEPPGTSAVRFSATGDTAGTGTSLISELGTSSTAGTWVNSAGRTVGAVTDEKATAEVKRAGVEPKMVSHSMNELKAAQLRSALGVAGSAWVMDHRTNQVVAQADSAVSATDWSDMTKTASGIAIFVHIERTKGIFTTRLDGVQPILPVGGRCPARFKVTNGQTDFILHRGHCGPTVEALPTTLEEPLGSGHRLVTVDDDSVADGHAGAHIPYAVAPAFPGPKASSAQSESGS